MTTTFTEGVQGSLAPWADPAGDWQAFNAALASMFEQVYGIVSDQGSPDEPSSYAAGWSTLLDPTACPEAFLPYCGMFVGVVVPPGTDEATARAKIIAEQNFQRGTGFADSYTTSTIPAGGAIVGAAQRFLSGTQSVTLFERTASDGSTPDAYHFVLVVLTSQVIDAGQLTAAVNAVKPAGVQWTLIETATWTIAELESAYATIALAEAAFPTVSNLETDVT